MKNPRQLKGLIYNQLQEMLDRKIESAKKAIESAKEARDSDTKSSVGDKYETGRAMMQIELEKNEVQLNKVINLKRQLSQIIIEKKYMKVEFGSLVFTNQGNFFISIGIGKIEIDDEIYYAISLASPVGKVLFDKEVSDMFQFRGTDFLIRDIV